MDGDAESNSKAKNDGRRASNRATLNERKEDKRDRQSYRNSRES